MRIPLPYSSIRRGGVLQMTYIAFSRIITTLKCLRTLCFSYFRHQLTDLDCNFTRTGHLSVPEEAVFNGRWMIWRTDQINAESPGLTVWRRRWDSNPRGACAPNGFRVRAVMSTSVPLHRLPAGRLWYCIRIRTIRIASDSAKPATNWIFFSL